MVTSWNRQTRRALIVSGIALLLALAGVAAQSGKPAATKYPPQFPREGATKLFENEHVIVWEQIGRPKEAFVHKHIRDILYFPIDPGGGIAVQNPDGSKGTGSSLTQTIYNRPPTSMSYSKAGIGPHAEVMVDPSKPGRSIFVEIKGTEPKDCREWSTACP
jgi:hypothetical protein